MVCPGSKEGGGCKKVGVVYRIECKKCKEKGILAEYWGETARTAYERGKEHLAGMKGKVEANSLWKHSIIHHEGELAEEDLKMGVVEQHRSPLTRQVHEGVALETNGAYIILNSKAEWNSSGMPRIVIEHREVQEEDREYYDFKLTLVS